jgi:hypothetical protein
MCFLNTASTRLCAHSISCRSMASLKGSKVSRVMIYVMVFTTVIKIRHSPLEFILEFKRFYCRLYYCSRSVNCRNMTHSMILQLSRQRNTRNSHCHNVVTGFSDSYCLQIRTQSLSPCDLHISNQESLLTDIKPKYFARSPCFIFIKIL